MDVVIDETFEANYSCEVLSELPNGIEPYYFSKYGSGVGFIVRIRSAKLAPWIGVFTATNAYPKALNGVYFTPNPNSICTIVGGELFYGDVHNPDCIARVEFEPIFHAFSICDRNMLILGGFTRLVAFNKSGLTWKSESISTDSMEISHVEGDVLFGTFWDLRTEAKSEFQVCLSDGQILSAASP